MAIAGEGPAANIKTHYLFYNGSGELTRDSIVSAGGDLLTYTLTRSGDMVINTITGNPQLEPAAGARDTLLFEKGNLRFFRRSHPQRYIRTELQFDTRHNPIGRLNIAPILPVLGFESDPTNSFWSVWQYGRNNLTRYRRWTGIYPTPDEDYVRTYT